MTPIQTKVQQLRANGIQILDLLPEAPLPGGGAWMAVPSLSMAIYQAPGAGLAYEVHGSILVRYNAALGPLGVFGYPETDEMDWFDAIARASVFQNGAIRWDPVGGVDVEMDKLAFSTKDRPITGWKHYWTCHWPNRRPISCAKKSTHL